MASIPQELSDSILEEYTIISVKINYAPDEYIEDSNDEPPEQFGSVTAYFKDLKLNIIYSACGLHLNGKSKRPHIHYVCVVKDCPAGTFRSAQSTHRNRWLLKSDNELYYTMSDVSISFPKKENPVWQCLSYPFKEGYPIKKGLKMSQEYYDFLLPYGKNLYQVSLGNRQRNDAHEERKKEQLLDLGKLCLDNRGQFNDFRSMTVWLEDAYIKKLPLEKKPSFVNYKANCQKVGNELGLFRYCDNM